MLISVCIPQYNRSGHLLRVLDSIGAQDYADVEIVVSDDNSRDNTAEVVPPYLEAIRQRTGKRVRYVQQASNLGYDGNVRAALSAAGGDYLFLLGNDDALACSDAISHLVERIREFREPDVVLCNTCEFGNLNRIQKRVPRTAILGSGPETALRTFRSFSFFGGIAYKRTRFLAENTARFDGSIYIQIYLAARIIASGGCLAGISRPLVAKDVLLDGKPADTYRDTLALKNAEAAPKTGGLDCVGWVATEAIAPSLPPGRLQRVIRRAFGQLLLWSYPYWLMDYRSLGVPRAARNLALGCKPPSLLRHVRPTTLTVAWLWVLYVVATTGGLLAPVGVLRVVARLLKPLSRRT